MAHVNAHGYTLAEVRRVKTEVVAGKDKFCEDEGSRGSLIESLLEEELEGFERPPWRVMDM